MPTIRKTIKEIEKELPLTQERLAQINATPDEDIDTSDIPELTDEFFKNAQVRHPTTHLNTKGTRGKYLEIYQKTELSDTDND